MSFTIVLDTNKALKEISRTKGNQKYEKALKEARLMSQFQCNGIPVISSIIEDEQKQLAYIIMEYIPGKSLQEIMTEQKTPFSQSFVVDIGIKVANIVNYLHSLDPPIIHRDIKPANIIYVERDQSVWLLDFGEAKVLHDNNEKDAEFSGTPEFMAPEQESENRGGRQISDKKSDIFSLGASLYYMLTGKICTKSKITNQYYSISDIFDRVSPRFNDAISKATDVTPGRRFATIGEFGQELYRCTTEYGEIEQDAKKRIRRFVFCLFGTVLFSAIGLTCLISNNINNNQTYEALLENAVSSGGITEDKIENALAAIKLKPYELEAYEALRTLYDSDDQFTLEEENKFKGVITSVRDELSKNEGYSEFVYDVGMMYITSYSGGNDTYIKAIDWFAAVSPTSEHYEVAQVYCKIGEFDRDIGKKLNAGEESGEFAKQWNELMKALDMVKQENNELLLLRTCQKVISAMDEYCLKLKKDGITKNEIEKTYQEVVDLVDSVARANDFTYETLVSQMEDDKTKLGRREQVYLEIYPFFSSVPTEISKVYGEGRN